MAESIAHSHSTVTETVAGKTFQESWVWRAKIGETRRLDVDGRTMVLTCVSERPLILEIENFLSDAECDHIIQQASSSLASSQVMGSEYTKNISSNEAAPNTREYYRSSSNAWLPLDNDLRGIQRRLGESVGISADYIRLKSEDLQVVRYLPGEQFMMHHDSSTFLPRLFTALLYLNDLSADESSSTCSAGGGTFFPFAGPQREFTMTIEEAVKVGLEQAVIATVSDDSGTAKQGAGYSGVEVRPKKGKVAIFFNHLQDGQIDAAAVHAGMKLHTGEKWVANYWVLR